MGHLIYAVIAFAAGVFEEKKMRLNNKSHKDTKKTKACGILPL